MFTFVALWCRGVVIVTSAQFPSTKPELWFRVGSYPVRGVPEICDAENL